MNPPFKRRSAGTGRILLGLVLACGIYVNVALSEEGGAPPSLRVGNLSLGEAIQLALQHNRTLEAERKNLKVAHGIALEARAILLPQLKVDGQWEPLDVHVPPNDSFGTPVPKRLWTGMVKLSESIYEGGRMRSGLHTAKWTEKRAVDQYNNVLSGVILKVRLAYDEALLAEAQIHFIEQFEATQKAEFGQVTDKVQAGSMTQLELKQAEVELANLEVKLITSRSQLKLALIRLLDLVGVDSSESAAASLRLTDGLALQPVILDLVEAVKQALTNRPDLKAMEKTVRLSHEDVVNARSPYKPSVQLMGGYLGFEDPYQREVYGWFGGAQASWVLFDGLRTHGKTQEAIAREEMSQVQLDDLKKQIDVEVRSAYFSVTEARERHGALQKAVDSAEEALRQTKAQLEAGGTTRFDVLRAERAKQDVEVSQLEALYSYNNAVAQLDHTLGLAVAPRSSGITNTFDNPLKTR